MMTGTMFSFRCLNSLLPPGSKLGMGTLNQILYGKPADHGIHFRSCHNASEDCDTSKSLVVHELHERSQVHQMDSFKIANDFGQDKKDGPEKESTCSHEHTNRQSLSMSDSFGPKWHQRFNKPLLTLSDVFAEQRKRATDVPTAAVLELQDARASHRSVHQPLDQNPSLVAGRKRRHKTIREHTISSSVAVFESIEPTDNAHFHPNHLDSVDNKGKRTSRLFSPVSKFDYGKRRRLFSVENHRLLLHQMERWIPTRRLC